MFSKSLLEYVLKWKGYPLAKAERTLSQLKSLDAKAFEVWQEKRRWAIFHFHVLHNPFYRAVVKENDFSDWSSIPVMAKGDFQGALKDRISTPYRGVSNYIANTSGSSGHPFYYAKDKFCHAITWALIKTRYADVGVSLSDLQGRFYGVPLEWKGNLMENIKDRVMNRIRFPVFDLSDTAMTRVYNQIVRNRVKYLYGYTSSLVIFARYLLRQKIVLKEYCPELKVCIVTSEVCTPDDTKVLSSGFGVRIINEYGASELGIMAFENSLGEMLGSDELIYFETHVNDTGNHELLCTSLFNEAFPIIRYKIGDLVSLEKRDGRTYFNQIEGRTNDLIHLPSGRIAAGLTFYYISRSILESSGVLREFIIRQQTTNSFVFDIVSDRMLTSEEEKLIIEKTHLYLEDGLEVTFNYVNKIQRPASGKIKHFYSEMA